MRMDLGAWRRRHLPQRFAGVVVLGTALLLLVAAIAGAAPASAQTVVSVTFDDGSAGQTQAGDMLAAHGMHGTFYINSARIGTSDYYMTWEQVDRLATDGNEIGGHTAHHANLTQTDPEEARRQICNDRVNLVNRGYSVTDFAYPYGNFNSSIQSMVNACGYNSARSVQGATSDTIPPHDPYAILESWGGGDLASLKSAVIQAEQNGGGWVPLTFHLICNGCGGLSVSPADFQAFLDWLEPRSANGTVVKTVHDVIGGSVRPPVDGPAAPPAPNGWNAIKNSSLDQDGDGDSLPDCYQLDTFGNNQFAWSRTSDAHTGPWAERVDVTGYQDGDNKLLVDQDLGFCTPSVTPGHQYRLTAWYKSSDPPFFAVFRRNGLGAFSYWESGPSFNASSSTWKQASWVTPPIPADTTGLSFGLTLAAQGFLTVDDLSMDDATAAGGGDTQPPTASVASPANGDTVTNVVHISVDATDNAAVDHVDYIVDGAVTGTSTSGPYSLDWNSRNVANGFHTISARAVDTAGNVTTASAITVFVSNSSTNLAKNPSLETASGNTPTCWTLGGYGTNSFAWTRTNDAHSGSFGEKLDVTSYTNGDRKLVTTQDTGACAASVVPGHSYTATTWYKSTLPDPNPLGSQPIIFAYYRNAAGSWVFWAQSPRQPTSSLWRQASWSTPAVPSGATAISVGLGLNTTGTVTMDDFALYDNAPPPDTTAPTTRIVCNDEDDAGGCANGYYGGSVQVALNATDNPGGTGVREVRYTTDGSTPSASNGSVYKGPFSLSTTTTVKYRAYDKAGNAEAAQSQLIRVDTTAPSTTIACNEAACSSGYYSDAVSIGLAATDTGGAGVDQIRYTTDGSDPTPTNGQTYLGAFSLSGTTTVKYRAYDSAGNPEPVQTQVIQIDTEAPTSTIACNAAPCTNHTYTSAVAVGLDASDGLGGSGVATIRYTIDGSDPTETHGNIYLSPFTFSLENTTTVKYRAFDNAGNAEPVNTALIHVDTSAPPTVALTSPTNGSTVNGPTTLSANVGDAAVTSVDFAVDGGSVASDSTAPYSVAWDSTSVGDGSHTITAHALDDANNEIGTDSVTVTVDNSGSPPPDTTPPASSISCNQNPCSSTTYYNSAVSVSLTATDGADGSGVQEIRYTTDGSDPSASNGTVYSGTFSVTTSTTIKYRAFDKAGNAEAVNSQRVDIDRVAPTSSIKCQGSNCAGTYYATTVTVTLAATDAGGSGVAEIRYTTDGSDPTAASGTVYGGGFTLTSTATVRYRAFDNAGNAEPVNSALIRVDTRPPSTTIKCNGDTCSGNPYQPGVSMTLAATDADSGVASIRYTTDGTDPTSTSGTVYSGAFSLSSSKTVKYRAFDIAGNTEPVNSQTVQIDASNPTVSLTSPKAGDALAGTVTLSADASDNVAVDHVTFLVDGQSVGSASSAPYSLAWDSRSVADGAHSVTARAVDTAGNATTSSAISTSVTNNNLVQNASLESASGGTPTCWTLGGYGNNTFSWTRTSDAHSGSFGEKLDVTAYTDGDRKLVTTQGTTTCSPSATPGRTYTVTAWYKSGAQPTIFAYYRNSSGAWTYWAQAPRLVSSTSWKQATWTTPAAPSGATAISVGPGIIGVGSVTMDDIGVFSNG
jgi:peptidoglycan/xylan/chitin deacetylase (PgdA/CDA1 family)